MATLVPQHPVGHIYTDRGADPVLGIRMGKWAGDRANGWVVRNGQAVCRKSQWLAPRGRVMRKAAEIARGQAARDLARFGTVREAFTTGTATTGAQPRVTLWHVQAAIALVGAKDGLDRETVIEAARIARGPEASPEVRAMMKAYDKERAAMRAARTAQRIAKSATLAKKKKATPAKR